MGIIADAPARHTTTVVLARGFLAGGVIGASLACLVVGVVVESGPLVGTGVGVSAVCGLLLFLTGVRRRSREAAVAPRVALAMIESLEVEDSSEPSSDVSVRFDLTVAPDDAPAYRVEITQNINVVDLPDYRPRGVLVVRYPPDTPWRVRIVKRPTPEWEQRVAGARLDSAPGPVMVSEPSAGGTSCFVTLLGLLLGAAVVVVLFRADLLDQIATQPPASTQPPVFPAPSSTVVSSSSGTVVLGPDRSFLDPGELGRAVGSLAPGGDTRPTLTVVVQERLLTVVFAPAGSSAPQFDPGSLPYDRVPALVEQATATLGVHSPQTWQLTADRLTGFLTIRVGVTGPEGTATLEADEQGQVVRRTPVR